MSVGLLLVVLCGASCSDKPAPEAARPPPTPPRPVVRRRTPEQERWALALDAILTCVNEGRYDQLGAAENTHSNALSAAANMKVWWGIETRADAERMIDWLKTEGHRAAFKEMGKVIASAPPDKVAETRASLAGDPLKLNQFDMAARYHTQLGRNGIIAWDWVRIIQVAGDSARAGHITEEEAWATIMPIARAMQRKYSSWREVGEGFMAGYRFWTIAHMAPRNKFVAAHVMLLGDTNSVWHTIPWDLDLTPQPLPAE